MNSLMKKLLAGAATLAIASTPLVASAQDWHHDNGRHEGQHHQREIHRVYQRPVYHPAYHRYNEGYYGRAPGGYNAYYHNGGWYHHRRQQAGVFIYF